VLGRPRRIWRVVGCPRECSRQALSNPCADTNTTNHQPPTTNHQPVSDPRPRAETKQLCAGRHNFSACRTQSHRSYGDDEGEVYSLVRVLGLHREESDKHGKVLWSVEAALTFDADSRPPKSCASMCDILRVLALSGRCCTTGRVPELVRFKQ